MALPAATVATKSDILSLNDMPGLKDVDGYIRWRFLARAGVMAIMVDTVTCVTYLAQMDNRGNVSFAALQDGRSTAMERPDFMLFSAILNCCKQVETHIHITNIMQKCTFGNGRQAIRTIDDVMLHQGNDLVIMASSSIVNLECKDMKAAESFISMFRMKKMMMGSGLTALPNPLGCQLLHKSLRKVPELQSVLSLDIATQNLDCNALLDACDRFIHQWKLMQHQMGGGGMAAAAPDDVCHYCKKRGHREKDCRKKQSDQRKGGNGKGKDGQGKGGGRGPGGGGAQIPNKGKGGQKQNQNQNQTTGQKWCDHCKKATHNTKDCRGMPKSMVANQQQQQQQQLQQHLQNQPQLTTQMNYSQPVPAVLGKQIGPFGGGYATAAVDGAQIQLLPSKQLMMPGHQGSGSSSSTGMVSKTDIADLFLGAMNSMGGAKPGAMALKHVEKGIKKEKPHVIHSWASDIVLPGKMGPQLIKPPWDGMVSDRDGFIYDDWGCAYELEWLNEHLKFDVAEAKDYLKTLNPRWVVVALEIVIKNAEIIETYAQKAAENAVDAYVYQPMTTYKSAPAKYMVDSGSSFDIKDAERGDYKLPPCDQKRIKSLTGLVVADEAIDTPVEGIGDVEFLAIPDSEDILSQGRMVMLRSWDFHWLTSDPYRPYFEKPMDGTRIDLSVQDFVPYLVESEGMMGFVAKMVTEKIIQRAGDVIQETIGAFSYAATKKEAIEKEIQARAPFAEANRKVIKSHAYDKKKKDKDVKPLDDIDKIEARKKYNHLLTHMPARKDCRGAAWERHSGHLPSSSTCG
jgi:uncharacterized membrane protein YgcG